MNTKDITTKEISQTPSQIEYPLVDPLVKKIIDNLPQCSNVQYSTRDQLKYLKDIARKLGLYDAIDILNNIIG